ncbi:MAG: hypothetical protein WCK77_08355 [Verrucomicrobiota bacterium]
MEATAPTFATRCIELRTQIGRIQSREAEAQLVRTMENILVELAIHLDRAAQLAKTKLVFSTVEGMPKPVIDATAVKSLKKTVGTLTGKLDNNRSQIGGGNTWADCVVKAKGLADALERDLRRIWMDYIAVEQPGYAVFNAYRGLPKCRPILSELDRLAGTLNELKRTLPQDPSPIFKVRETAALMREKIASLGLGDTPPEVAEFLKKCATDGGAPLSDLTPEIFKWIREQGFAGDLRVTPR